MTTDVFDLKTEGKTETGRLKPEISKICLRGYQLHDNIILSNFENITHLEVSNNNIEYLDLSTLKNLEIVQCRRNILNELTLYGRCLLSLTATHSDLTKITISPPPSKLVYLDISCNKLLKLPTWVDKCHQLETLHANNNVITSLPNHIINNDKLSLSKTKETVHLRELCLQSNQLKKIPEHLFITCNRLLTLNISNNTLDNLPIQKDCLPRLERLYATKNLLNNTVLDNFSNLKQLKVLHVAFNKFTTLPNETIKNWQDLEELVLSGNKLKDLPENISFLKKLRVLRIHSNQLQSIPDLSQINTLRVIDLAHNQLSKINLITLLPTNLQFLDLSCNQQLQVDSGQLKSFQSQRKVSFVDVSGKNRYSLPTSTSFDNSCNSFSPWKVGFSETPGNCRRLYISQLRLPNFCKTDGLFGIFDGEIRTTARSLLPKIIPTILLHQRTSTIKETAVDYMKYTLISAYKKLNQTDKKHGERAILCHITKEKQCHELSGEPLRSRKYILRAAIIGGTTAYLIKKQGPVHLPPTPSSKPRTINDVKSSTSETDADTFEISLSNDDEYLVIASKRIWETINVETVVQEVRSEENVILAAKRIQDLAQSFGAEENISIIILKFQNVETYVDLLIHELRENVRRKTSPENFSGRCNSADEHFYGKQLCANNSDHSSPIGQTDQEISELSVCLKRIKSDTYCFAESGISSLKLQSSGEDNLSRGYNVLEEESEQNPNETDSILSDEQFKCWEYMLEQNTQLLFDKELNKISNSFIKNKNSTSSINLNGGNNPTTFNIMHSASKRKISSSFPQLINRDVNEYPSYQKDSFAAKHYGTSFQQFSTIKGRNVNSMNRANVGYFGSLQHLMPYNFEDDFAVTHERQFGDESLEYASRMSQYWGVTTTEL